jgi:hypothetical protein
MMEITLGLVIWLKSALRRTATIGAATGVVILIDSIDLSNTAMARCSKSGGMRTTSVGVQDIYWDATLFWMQTALCLMDSRRQLAR